MRLTTAYAMIVNGGKKFHLLLLIEYKTGEENNFKNDLRRCENCELDNYNDLTNIPKLVDEREQITDPGSAYQMVSMLREL